MSNDDLDALGALVQQLKDLLILQAKLTAYYNGKGADCTYPSPNYPGKEVWWDYLSREGRAVLAVMAKGEHMG